MKNHDIYVFFPGFVIHEVVNLKYLKASIILSAISLVLE
jgi:hypothetical protein